MQALALRAYGPWVPLLGRRPAPMDDDYERRVDSGEVFVLVHGEAILGFAVLEDLPGALWLDNLAVEPTLQGAGLGKRLLAFCEAEARRRDHAEIRLLTNALMRRNIALYERWGFVETGRAEQQGLQRVFMAKRLAD